MKKQLSTETAVKWLRAFYGDGTSDYVSMEEIFANTGRSDKPVEVNKGWGYNMMSSLKRFGYFEKEYETRDGARYTKGIRLTAKGRQALRDQVTPESLETLNAPESQFREVTFTSVLDDVQTLRKKYPEFEISFDARLKKGEEVSM